MITTRPASVAAPRPSPTQWARSISVLPDQPIWIAIAALCLVVAVPALAQTPATSTYGPIITTVAGCCENTGNPGSEGSGGDGGEATEASLWFPSGVAVDVAGSFYIADQSNSLIRKVNVATGVITTVAGGGSCGSDYCGDGGPATGAALYYPSTVTLDSANNLYIADTFNNVIRKVTAATGIITTLAGNGTAGYGGDSGPATEAELYNPEGVAVDSAGNVYIADTWNNHVVRKVTASTGMITTVAGTPQSEGFGGDGGPATSALLNMPWGVAVDTAGNFYIADSANDRIRKVTVSTGMIATVAGSGSGRYTGDGAPATSAGLNVPRAVTVDTAGNFYIADYDNSVVRKVTSSTGLITTVAGCCENTGLPGAQGYSGDGGAATSAELRNPPGVAVDLAGNLYVADQGNNVIRKVATGAITTTTLTSSVNPSTGGEVVTFTATVTAFTGSTPTGMVTFKDGATSIGSMTLNGAGVTTLPYGNLTAAGSPHSITATYNGSTKDAPSTSAVISQVVNFDTTSTALASSPNPSTTGQSVTLTATVTPGNGVAAAGAVSFYNGSTLLGNASLSGGTATLSHAFTGGIYNLSAKYTGSNYKLGSTSNQVSQMVTPVPTTTVLSSSPNPSTGGQTITFTAMVMPPPTYALGLGSVKWMANGVDIGSHGLLTDYEGVVTLNDSSLVPSGTPYSVVAVYVPPVGGELAGSTSSAVSQTVNMDMTTTALGASPNPSTSGQSVALTATVTPGNGIAATGTVSFYNGSKLLGNASLSGGVATLNHAFTTGTYSLTAKYTGSNYKSPSTSSVVTQTVN